MEPATLLSKGHRHHALVLYKDPDLPKSSTYTLEPGQPTPGWPYLLRPPLPSNIMEVVQEY
jgi:hypothetical protein